MVEPHRKPEWILRKKCHNRRSVEYGRLPDNATIREASSTTDCPIKICFAQPGTGKKVGGSSGRVVTPAHGTVGPVNGFVKPWRITNDFVSRGLEARRVYEGFR